MGCVIFGVGFSVGGLRLVFIGFSCGNLCFLVLCVSDFGGMLVWAMRWGLCVLGFVVSAPCWCSVCFRGCDFLWRAGC